MIADAGEVVDEHSNIDFFALLEFEREAGVIAAREETQARRASTGAMMIDAAPVTNFQRTAARCS